MIDVLTLLQQYNIKYEHTSSGYKVHCLNPYHKDKNPSMHISKDFPNLFHCFSCGYKGNIFTLIKVLTGTIAKEYLKENYIYNQTYTKPKKRNMALEIKGNMYRFDYNTHNADVDLFLQKRNITKEFIDYYDLKFCTYMTINKTIYSNRILIPIKENGKLVSIEGRTYNHNKVKVLYPSLSNTNLLFNIDRLDTEKPLYVVEGTMDLPPLFNLGLRNITCTFGTNLSDYKIKSLNKFKEIILIPDNDTAGNNMISKLDAELENEFYIVKLPEEFGDLGDVKDLDLLQNLLNNKVISIAYLLEKLEMIEKEVFDWS